MRGLWARIKLFFRRYHKAVVIITPILFIALIAGVFWFINRSAPEETSLTVNKKTATPTTVASLVNGEMVAAEKANSHPVAVMIENSPAARPQVGLTDADVVYEAVTEGGITRFMGIFSQTYPEKAGPVRSARSYFIDWLSEYDAFYAHAGGSPTALSRISSYGIKDYPHANDSYTRIPEAGVASEHTLFVNVAKIYEYGQSKKGWPATFDTKPWVFKDPSTATTAGTTPKVTINFSTSQFQVVWTHEPITNMYTRTMGGSAHKDRSSGSQILARTVVTMNVSHSANPPYAGTGKESEWNMTTTGTGAASVFQDGQRINGTWKKASRVERTRFYDEAGAEIKLNRGKIWIEVVPQEGSISVTTPTT